MARAAKITADKLMNTLHHPLKPEIDALRKIITEVNPALQERVKWNAPSYYFNETDLAAFNLRQTKFVQLIVLFPNGLVDDPSKIMLGEWKDRREVRFAGMTEVNEKKEALQQIIREWFATVD